MQTNTREYENIGKLKAMQIPVITKTRKDTGSRIVMIYAQTSELGKFVFDLLFSKAQVVGMDCEFGETKRVATVQLAYEQYAALFHVHHFKSFPDYLQRCLTSESVIKVGRGVLDDFYALSNTYPTMRRSKTQVHGMTLDVAELIHSVSGHGGMASLKVLGAAVLNEAPIESGGNWKMQNLDNKRVIYACQDAFLGYALCRKAYEMVSTNDSFEEWCKTKVQHFAQIESTTIQKPKQKQDKQPKNAAEQMSKTIEKQKNEVAEKKYRTQKNVKKNLNHVKAKSLNQKLQTVAKKNAAISKIESSTDDLLQSMKRKREEAESEQPSKKQRIEAADDDIELNIF